MKYNFQIQKLNKRIDRKIKFKLFLMYFNKNFNKFFESNNFKIILPIFSLIIIMFGFFSYLNFGQKNPENFGGKSKQITQNLVYKDYRKISQNRVIKAKINYYKKYSSIRKFKSFIVR